MRRRDGVQRVWWKWMYGSALRTEANMIELIHVFVIHHSTTNMIQSNPIVNSQAWRCCCKHDMCSIWRPLADGSIASFKCADFCEILGEIIDVNLTSQITKTCYKHKSSMRGECNSIAWPKWKAICRLSFGVENCGLGWHISVDYTKFFGVWRPRNVMNWALLVL